MTMQTAAQRLARYHAFLRESECKVENSQPSNAGALGIKDRAIASNTSSLTTMTGTNHKNYNFYDLIKHSSHRSVVHSPVSVSDNIYSVFWPETLTESGFQAAGKRLMNHSMAFGDGNQKNQSRTEHSGHKGHRPMDDFSEIQAGDGKPESSQRNYYGLKQRLYTDATYKAAQAWGVYAEYLYAAVKQLGEDTVLAAIRHIANHGDGYFNRPGPVSAQRARYLAHHLKSLGYVSQKRRA